MFSPIVTIIMLVCYFYLEGFREALYYHEAVKTNDTITTNMHPLFSIQRVSVFIIVWVLSGSLLLVLSAIFMFSFAWLFLS
jgi:hypothetical protein